MKNSLESLDVWKRSVGLSTQIYDYFRGLKDYGFKDQITRSGLSIPSNIAEGFKRDSYKEFSNFLKYAKGSAGELKTQIIVGMKIGYIEKNTGLKWLEEVTEIGKMIGGLRTTVIAKSEA